MNGPPHRKRKLLGAELASRLTGRAWDVTSADIDHERLQQRDGPAYLLQFLEQRLCKAPIPDSGQRLEDFFIRLRRRPGSSMTEWASQLRESYRRLQRALARQRHDRGETPSKSVAAASPTSLRMRSTPDSRRRRSDVTSPQRQESEEWQAFPEIPREREVNTGVEREDRGEGDAEQQQEPNEDERDHAGYRQVPTSDRGSSSGWHEQRWTSAEWQEWHRWKGWKEKTWGADSSDDEEDVPIRWEQFEFSDVQVLPTEILGWLLLRRSGLPAGARLSVLSAINNSLDLDTMERAMRDQEEELLLAESARSHHQLPKPRRSFWVEQDSHWGLVNDFDPEEVEDSSIMWVGSQLPEEVHGRPEVFYNETWSTSLPGGQELQWEWCDDDFYAEDQDGVFWSWSETKDWLDMEEYYSAAPEAAGEIQEAYNVFQQKMRSFKDSRVLNNAKQLSRGYYPFSSFKGKSKGKGKQKGKGSGKKGSHSTSPSASTAGVVAFGQKGSSGQRPGNPEYRGCFICGSKEHDFRSCPKRQSSSSTSHRSSNLVQSIYMVESVEDDGAEEPWPSFVVLSDSEEGETKESEEPGAALATLAQEFPGHAIIDSGATDSIGSLEALEQIMNIRTRRYGQEEIRVHERQKKFRFGNGESKKAASYVEIPQQVNGQTINLGIHALDAPGVPLLISVKTLSKMQAVVDFGKSRMCLCSVSPTCWIPLKKVANGHLLIDLTQDWFKDQPVDEKAKSSLTQDIFASSEYKGAQQFGSGSHEEREDNELAHVSKPSHPSSDQHVAVKPPECHEQSDEEELIPDGMQYSNLACRHTNLGDSNVNAPDLGSNMHFVLPALVALSAVHPFDHGRSEQDWLSFTQGGDREEGRAAATVQWQTNSKGPTSFSYTGALRHESDPGSRPKGCPCSRTPLLGCTPSNARGARKPLRPERPRHVEGVPTMPFEDLLHTGIRLDRDIPAGGSIGSRCGHGDERGQGQDQRPTLGEGEAQQQDLQHPWSRSIFEGQAKEVGERQVQEYPEGEAWNIGSIDTATDHGDQEGPEESRREVPRGEGGRDLVGGMEQDQHSDRDAVREQNPVEILGEDNEGHVKKGTLNDARKAYLMEKIDDFIGEVDKIYEELVGFEEDCWIMEVCCPPDSRLVETFLKHNKKALRIGLPAFDVSTKSGVDELKRMISTWRPDLVWFSLPCGPYSQIQELFNESTPEKLEKSLARKRKAKRMIHNGLDVAIHQVSQGGEIAWEWPVGNRGWNLPRVREFWNCLRSEGKLHTARADGCSYGLKSSKGVPLRKPWRIQTTLEPLARALHRQSPGHEHHDECLGGKEARNSGFYPQAMCDVIYKTMWELKQRKKKSEKGAIFPVFGSEQEIASKMTDVTPLTSEERKQALRMVEKLHRRTGHPSNTALANVLKHRGAHHEVVELAWHHNCTECQELKAAPLHPSVALQKSEVLWETLVLDNAEVTIDKVTYHFMLMVDEASRLLCPHFLFQHGAEDSRNATGNEVLTALTETWIRHYGMPAKIRLDPEGAFRSNMLSNWCEERGIEVLPCAAEAHGQIGIVERAIQSVKATVKQLTQGGEFEVREAIIQACCTYNEMERVEGYSPFQWAFGRQPTLAGRFHDRGYDDPWWTSTAVPGSSMNMNLRMRVSAQQAFLKHQAHEIMTRAANAKTRKKEVFLPGDLVYFKRVKPPAQPQAHVRLPHRLWRWYGPARVLASETRNDGQGMERHPTHIIWIVSHGRLKRCSPDQLRHASERERVIAEGMDSPVTSWTFHSLIQTLYKGEYEILDQNLFPEDVVAQGAPKTPRRSHSVGRQAREKSPARPAPSTPGQRSVKTQIETTTSKEMKKTPQKQVEKGLGGEGAHREAKVPRIEKMAEATSKSEKNEPRDETRREVARSSSEVVDFERFRRDPTYQPIPVAVHGSRNMADLFEQPVFKKQRKELGVEEDDEVFVSTFIDDNHKLRCEQFAVEIDLELPQRSSEWRSLKRSPENYYTKKIKGAEVRWHLLNPDEKEKFKKAKESEVSQWLAASAVRRALGPIPADRLVQMRWVLTWKDNGQAKGRIVLIGYQDPDLASIRSTAPTMTRRTRQLALQYTSCRSWRSLKADVKAAFLQGDATEESRQLFAVPVPELASSLGCREGEAVQVLKACYGLVSAPASWFQCVRRHLAELNFTQSRTDPCLWFLYQGEGPDRETLGFICSHPRPSFVPDDLVHGVIRTAKNLEKAKCVFSKISRFFTLTGCSGWA